jgi:hypothetical protein
LSLLLLLVRVSIIPRATFSSAESFSGRLSIVYFSGLKFSSRASSTVIQLTGDFLYNSLPESTRQLTDRFRETGGTRKIMERRVAGWNQTLL